MNDQLAEAPDKFYRFRSIQNLIGQQKELEQLTLYFASPDELNDPMEGYMDLVWEGDQIIWNNLFKHFIYCFQREYIYTLIKCQITDPTIETPDFLLESNPHLINNTWNDPPSPAFGNTFDAVYKEVQRKVKIAEVAYEITNMERKIRWHELKFYLDCILPPTLKVINKYAVDNSPLKLDDNLFDDIEPSESVLTATKYFEVANSDSDFFKSERSALFQKLDGQRIHQIYELYKNIVEPLPKYILTLLHNFTSIYIDNTRILLWPEWYAVCFSECFSNPVLWSNYADEHKGVCLIFGTETYNGKQCIELHQANGSLGDTHSIGTPQRTLKPFTRVMYSDERSEINFFKNMGAVPSGILQENWYSDEMGNISTCDPRTKPEFDIEAWQQEYWHSFHTHHSTKGQVWEYEKEWRLIENGLLQQVIDKNKRIYKYSFSALKGIIFGMRTSDEDKIKVIDIIKRMPSEAKRTDFSFYQAYYHHGEKNIQAYPLIVSPSSAISEPTN